MVGIRNSFFVLLIGIFSAAENAWSIEIKKISVRSVAEQTSLTGLGNLLNQTYELDKAEHIEAFKEGVYFEAITNGAKSVRYEVVRPDGSADWIDNSHPFSPSNRNAYSWKEGLYTIKIYAYRYKNGNGPYVMRQTKIRFIDIKPPKFERIAVRRSKVWEDLPGLSDISGGTFDLVRSEHEDAFDSGVYFVGVVENVKSVRYIIKGPGVDSNWIDNERPFSPSNSKAYNWKSGEYTIKMVAYSRLNGKGNSITRQGKLQVDLSEDGEDYEFPTEGIWSGIPLDLVSTFHSISLYWKPGQGAQDRPVLVRYRKKNSNGPWKEAHEAWYDNGVRKRSMIAARKEEYRSSIVKVNPGTLYEVEAYQVGTERKARGEVRTWNEEFPVDSNKVFRLPEVSNQPLQITTGGSPGAYALYTVKPGKSAKIDVKKNHPYNINVKASYVIIRGLKLRGAKSNGIFINNERHHIVIENNNISAWGSKAGPENKWAADNQAAVKAVGSKVTNVVIQNNLIHNPSHDSNNWKEKRRVPGTSNYTYHPMGAHAVKFYNTGGNHVIRYNTIRSTNGNYFNDGIGGGYNFNEAGAPGKDSDIYGNYISHCWDDAIEAEGGNANVRIYENFTTNNRTSYGLSPIHHGPVYVFRNVAAMHRYSHKSYHVGSGSVFKFQTYNNKWGGGRLYLYHNTLKANSDGKSASAGLTRSGKKLRNAHTANNIIVPKNAYDFEKNSSGNAIVHNSNYIGDDLVPSSYASRLPASVKERTILGSPDFKSSGCTLCLKSSSPGFDEGIVIPNFNDHFMGDKPDVGAYETGSSSINLIYGVRP
tara:strand:+ start:66783 stop:69227 length:2445 start_codon:yes stop_codon:yes gene_type:complete